MKKSKLRGYIASALIPYDANFQIDENEYVRHLQEISTAEGLCAVYVNAWVGEVFTLSRQERIRIVQLARATVPKEIPIISGIIGFNLAEMVEAGHAARDAGASVLEVFPPFDNLFLRRLMAVDEVPVAFFKELGKELDTPLSIFKYASERGLSYSTEAIVRIADEVEQVISIKASCLTSSDYYQLHARIKDKLSVFATGGDSVDLLGMMLIGADGAQGGIMALGRTNWTTFISHAIEGRHQQARDLYMEKCAPIADYFYGSTLSSFRKHRRGSTTALIKEGLVASGRFSSARLRSPDLGATDQERQDVVKVMKSVGALA